MKARQNEVTDEFWSAVKPLIPPPRRDERKTYQRKPGAGRKSKPTKLILEGIIYMLRTGCRWKELPKERFGSSSSIHKYFLAWEEAGFFETLWRAGLAECDELEGIAWCWRSADGLPAKETEKPLANGRPWRPALFQRGRSSKQ
jgi:transposase